MRVCEEDSSWSLLLAHPLFISVLVLNLHLPCTKFVCARTQQFDVSQKYVKKGIKKS